MKGKIMVLVAVMAMLVASFAIADAREAETTEGESGTLDLNEDAGSYEVTGGDVTEINLSTDASTSRWQGFFGNTSATLALGLGSSIMYDFGQQDVTAVYATVNEGLDFSALEAVDAEEVDNIWSFTDGSDRAQFVFNETMTQDGIDDVASLQNGNFQSFVTATEAIPSVKTEFAFGAVVDNDGAEGFNGNIYNYELMVPTEDSTETYYFFMRI